MGKPLKLQKVRYKKKTYTLLETNENVFVLKSIDKKRGKYFMLYIPRADEDQLQKMVS